MTCGPHSVRAAHSLRNVGRLGDHLEAIGAVKDVANAAPHNLMVVEHHHGDVGHATSLIEAALATRDL